ncbi:MAG: hypothetical protein QOE86_2504 [Solirubrobacteraceae bacterium]|nr:hypothetical protein [Solirubrobacteraceae bacterium]
MRRRRAVAQLLHRPAGLSAAGAVRHLLAVQAQDARSARLALRARLGAPPDDDGALVVTWLLRGTLHLVHRDDLPWLHAVTAPTRMRASDRRLRELGLDPADALARVRAALPFTRAEAGERLGLTGQAIPHALMRTALEGHCVGDLDGRWVATDIEPVDRDRALDELARRFAVAHPGADLAAWAGIARRDARPIPDFGVAPQASGPRLLPPFDPYLIAYRDAVPQALRERVFPGGGMFRATAVDDGVVRGTWTMPRGRVVLDPPELAADFADEIAALEAIRR